MKFAYNDRRLEGMGLAAPLPRVEVLPPLPEVRITIRRDNRLQHRLVVAAIAFAVDAVAVQDRCPDAIGDEPNDCSFGDRVGVGARFYRLARAAGRAAVLRLTHALVAASAALFLRPLSAVT